MKEQSLHSIFCVFLILFIVHVLKFSTISVLYSSGVVKVIIIPDGRTIIIIISLQDCFVLSAVFQRHRQVYSFLE